MNGKTIICNDEIQAPLKEIIASCHEAFEAGIKFLNEDIENPLLHHPKDFFEVGIVLVL